VETAVKSTGKTILSSPSKKNREKKTLAKGGTYFSFGHYTCPMNLEFSDRKCLAKGVPIFFGFQARNDTSILVRREK